MTQPFLPLLVLSLGIRHGFDLDHLATIDAMTRSVQQQPKLAKITGLLFSLGHGLVVIAISAIIGAGFLQTMIPDWLEPVGSWISTFFLLAFGCLTLLAMIKQSSTSHHVQGPRSFLLNRLINQPCHPLFMIGIGAMFAFSFDTMTQVALFSVSNSLLSGWFYSVVLGFVFMLGMMLADGLNGLLVSKLLQRAEQKSLFISQAFSALIVLFSLSLGLMQLMELVTYS